MQGYLLTYLLILSYLLGITFLVSSHSTILDEKTPLSHKKQIYLFVVTKTQHIRLSSILLQVAIKSTALLWWNNTVTPYWQLPQTDLSSFSSSSHFKCVISQKPLDYVKHIWTMLRNKKRALTFQRTLHSGLNRKENRKRESSIGKVPRKTGFVVVVVIFFLNWQIKTKVQLPSRLRVWCLLTKCNALDQVRPFHWSTSHLEHLLPACWQKVSSTLFLTALYTKCDMLTNRKARFYSKLGQLYREISFPMLKFSYFGQTGYCSVH